MRRRKGENIQNFAERLRTAAIDDFENISSPGAQRTLDETFQKGIESDYLSWQIIRKKLLALTRQWTSQWTKREQTGPSNFAETNQPTRNPWTLTPYGLMTNLTDSRLTLTD